MRIRTIASVLARLFRFVRSMTVMWEAHDGICTVMWEARDGICTVMWEAHDCHVGST